MRSLVGLSSSFIVTHLSFSCSGQTWVWYRVLLFYRFCCKLPFQKTRLHSSKLLAFNSMVFKDYSYSCIKYWNCLSSIRIEIPLVSWKFILKCYYSSNYDIVDIFDSIYYNWKFVHRFVPLLFILAQPMLLNLVWGHVDKSSSLIR